MYYNCGAIEHEEPSIQRSEDGLYHVCKAVRVDRKGRLVSVVLPEHLAVTYRTRAGRIITVPSALAFESEPAATHWVRMMIAFYQMQVWHAVADEVAAKPAIITYVEAKHGRWGNPLERLNGDALDARQWEALVAKLRRKRSLSDIDGGRMWATIASPPQGSVECTNLKLVEQIT